MRNQVKYTTWHLVEDLEKLRKYLKIKNWIVTGGSWGSTLALAYAQSYPESVKGIIIRGVFTARASEMDWLFSEKGVGQIWPDEFEKFISVLNKTEKKDIIKSFYKRLNSKTKKISWEAAKAFAYWEGTIMTLIPDKKETSSFLTKERTVAIAKIECHYTLNNFFIKVENGLYQNINNICPMRSAYDLHKSLPGSKLSIVPNGSHSPLELSMAKELIKAGEEFKKIW